ncbi:acyl-CoA thioesterase [Novosphingobium sp. 9]|uniref:acyl-CoA thioesterase n=1 Tax=Novosphingobium sp. 9 TaxID=2025349 RepID=UPI0021B4E94B|nr:acyl-CoA thioesterase II [Novosphingobium sp. 9]
MTDTDILRARPADLAAFLEVEPIDTDLFRAPALPGPAARIFGGQVVAQALAAAGHDLDGSRPAHSLHAYFLRAGDTARPVIFRVLRDMDGGSFTHRRVVATQGGVPILNLAASFHRSEPGFAHQLDTPRVPSPEKCPSLAEALAAVGRSMPASLVDRLAAFEMRPCPPCEPVGGIPAQRTWLRLASPLGASPAMARVLLAYASDFALLGTSVLPHGVTLFTPDMQFASLDHAVWFHETPPLDDWVLYAMESPQAGHARGFTRGSVFTREGQLIASVTQEGLIRRKTRG